MPFQENIFFGDLFKEFYSFLETRKKLHHIIIASFNKRRRSPNEKQHFRKIKMRSQIPEKKRGEYDMIRYDILQIALREDQPEGIVYTFSNSDYLIANSELSFPPPEALYENVYTDQQEKIAPEDIFRKFNLEHPHDYKGRSLSVGDVIRYHLPNGQSLHLFCDSFGFIAIDFGDKYKVAAAPEYSPESESQRETVVFRYENGDNTRCVTVDVPLLWEGKSVACNFEGQAVELTVAEIYNAIKAVLIYRARNQSDKDKQTIRSENLIDIFEKFI